MTLAAMAALTAPTAGAAAKQARPAPVKETTAPRDAGEPIMAIVSIKTQHVTLYDTEGWILRAPVLDRNHGTRDASRRLCGGRQGKRSPLEHV